MSTSESLVLICPYPQAEAPAQPKGLVIGQLAPELCSAVLYSAGNRSYLHLIQDSAKLSPKTTRPSLLSFACSGVHLSHPLLIRRQLQHVLQLCKILRGYPKSNSFPLFPPICSRIQRHEETAPVSHKCDDDRNLQLDNTNDSVSGL
jgi:hypothetical protein